MIFVVFFLRFVRRQNCSMDTWRERVKEKTVFFRLKFRTIRTEAFCAQILLPFSLLKSESETLGFVTRRWFEVRWKALILALSMVGETSNLDHLGPILSALKFSDAPGSELSSAPWIRYGAPEGLQHLVSGSR